MALFQVIKFDGPAHILVWKHPKEDMNTGSRLVVGPSQEAVFVRGGQVCDVLGPGSYVLDTGNLPVLSGLVKLPFGKKSPFTAELFFVNKLDILDIKWGTSRPIQLRDPVYNVVAPLRAFGQYGIAVADSRLFLERLANAPRLYAAGNLAEYLRGIVGSRFAEELSSCLMGKKISFLEANAHLTEIAEGVAAAVRPLLAEYGVRLVNFCVASINVPEGDPSVRRLREVLDRRHEMDALQFNYEKSRSFDVLEEAARNLSGGSEAVGTGMGAALGAAMGALARETLQGQTLGQKPGFCSACGAALAPDAAFCVKCGKAVDIRCPRCGVAAQPGSRFCGKCGCSLT